MTTSKPLYIYLQRPDNGEWVTVGRYKLDGGQGRFLYAPSYLQAGLPWSIDPVNLPLVADTDYAAMRYGGLHDVLRDISPDSWGKMLLQREHHLPDDAHDSTYLRLARNAQRWGALAIGTSKRPDVAGLASPGLPQLAALAQELLALFERRPVVDVRVRRFLMATPSMGGARPKGTVKDRDDYWLVKPALPSDTVDIPLLEHVAQQWASLAGLHFARTEHEQVGDGLSVLRSLRFDRHGAQRHMTLSGATLLRTEYPGRLKPQQWSYPRLAEELLQLGAPLEDGRELFGRMVFNALVGNDDDHPRNHAAVYSHQEGRWRLAPAFDVVPNPDRTPDRLCMQLSMGRFDISREAVLADALRFGFQSSSQADDFLIALVDRVEDGFDAVAVRLGSEIKDFLAQRIVFNRGRLLGP